MHSELSSPSTVSSIFSPFLDLGSPTSILSSDSKLYLSSTSRTASPNLDSWVQISREGTTSPPFDWVSRQATTDSLSIPPLGASFYDSGDDIETGDSDCAYEDEDDEGDFSGDAAVEEALRASLASLLATRNLSQSETGTKIKPNIVATESGAGELHYSSASSFTHLVQGKNTPSPPRAVVPLDRKPTLIMPGSGGGDLRYKSPPPASSFNFSVQGKNTARAPHHSRLSAQQNASAFLDKPCLLCSLHLCQKQLSNQHRIISSSPPSPKLQSFPVRRSASCPTTPPPTPLLTPRKKKSGPLNTSCPSSRAIITPGEIVHASKRTSKNGEFVCHTAGVEVEGKEANIGASDANDKNTGDPTGEYPEGFFAWIARMWLNAGLKIKVLSAIALSGIFLGTGLSARSYFHQIRIKSAISTTSVLRL